MPEIEPHQSSTYEEKIEKMITMTVAAAKGIAPIGQVALPLAQIAGSDLAPPAAQNLARTLSRILQGERDPIALVEDLSPEHAELVWDTLEQIDAPLVDAEDLERQAISFEELVEKVAEACTGEVVLWQRLWAFTEELASDERLSPEIRTLGRVLRKILAGERQKYLLDELGDQHRWAVAQLLDWLNEQAAQPPDGG
jgi:hypothetical protein